MRGCMIPLDALVIAALPDRRRVGRSQREAYQPARRRKLNPESLRVIVHLAAQGRTLREIGAEVGLSHEAVRAVLRGSGSDFGTAA